MNMNRAIWSCDADAHRRGAQIAWMIIRLAAPNWYLPVYSEVNR